MKKLGIYFMMLAMMSVTFVACNNTDDPAPPVITVGVEEIVIDLENSVPVEVPVTVTSADEDLISVLAYVLMEDAKVWQADPVMNFGANPKAWEGTYTFSIPDSMLSYLQALPEGTVLTFTIEANILNGHAAKSVPIKIIGNLPPPPDTLLSDPIKFTWHRIGTKDGEGLTEFGLKWTSNTGTHIVITPLAGAKLVELKVEDWNLITTKEGLEKAVEEGTGLTEWKVIEAKITFNYVIATKTAEGKYFMINPTERTINENDPGDRTVTGHYKY